MEATGGRFRRPDRFGETRRALRAELLGLRFELEQLDEALRAGPTPISARAALDRAFSVLRTAERAWQDSRRPADLLTVLEQIDDARQALEASVAARARRRPGTPAG